MDNLTRLFKVWEVKVGKDDATLFEAFQGGLTAGAMSMRLRAQQAAQVNSKQNDIVNAIGALSDIPEQ